MVKKHRSFLCALIVSISIVDAVHGLYIDKRQQKDAAKTPPLPHLRPLIWGDVNFIHTTDTHGWLEGHVLEGSFNGDLGDFYSFTAKMREKARHLKKDLFIVDTGDTHDGNGLSDITDPRGLISQPLLTNIPYDLLTIGNHELYVNDVTVDTVENFIPHWKDRYLAANVYFKDITNNKTVPIGSKFTYFEGEFGTKVLAYGFLFNFQKNGDRSMVRSVKDEIQEPWFKQSLETHEPDVIVLIGHIGLRFEEFHVLIEAIREYFPTMPIAVLGGHTHIRDAVRYDAWAAGIESGRYLETIGFFSVQGVTNKNAMSRASNNVTFHRRYLDQNRPTYQFHSSLDSENHVASSENFDTPLGIEMTNLISELRGTYGLSKRLGCAPHDYRLQSAHPNQESSVFHLLTQEVLPLVVADLNRPNPAYFLINTGGVRYDIFKGPFLLDNMYQLSPFEDDFYSIENVPHHMVRQLLPKLNREGEQTFKKRDIWPYMSDKTDFAKRGNFAQLRDQTGSQNVDRHGSGGGLVPGYVTMDDFGIDGDDTAHIPIPDFPIPAFVGSSLPTNIADDDLIDVVYLDFFDNQLRTLLFDLSGKNWTANKEYGNPNITSSTMWIHFAQKYWNATDQTC
ncbi:Metallo-dependent phosphatase-like protein [Parasitella parasitica]|nr:Metallo-dependent phosphatase-like protein [Parasitella parasitica]